MLALLDNKKSSNDEVSGLILPQEIQKTDVEKTHLSSDVPDREIPAVCMVILIIFLTQKNFAYLKLLGQKFDQRKK